jgi:hypothetical protein
MKTSGLLGEFLSLEKAQGAYRRLQGEGLMRLELLTPVSPHPEPARSSAPGPSWALGRWALAGGLLGLFGSLGLEVFLSAWHYPPRVAGRPFYSWPSFVPFAFEITILGAALAVVLGFFILTGLPEISHPVLSFETFRQKSTSRHFIFVSVEDPYFHVQDWSAHLKAEGACEVHHVP